VLTRVHRLRLLHHAEHRLVDLVGDGWLAQHRNIERRIVEQQHFGAFQDEEARLVRLPRDLTVQNALVDPSHVLDALANGEVSIVELHLVEIAKVFAVSALDRLRFDIDIELGVSLNEAETLGSESRGVT
jgi:hypothetical protein